MMVLRRESGEIFHDRFKNFPSYLRKGDLLVINVTKVIKARLYGRKSTGAKIEVLLLRKTGENLWEALTKPAKRLKKGDRVSFAPGLEAEIAGEGEAGKRIIKFHFPIERELDKIGRVPLPPYIKREPLPEDEERYQTVFAREGASVAAPTAGLHFNQEILQKVREKAEIVEIVHNVGEATFRPLLKEEVEENRLPAEEYYISEKASLQLQRAKKEGRRIVAVGTTVVRALESAYSHGFSPGSHFTDLFIYPGYKFQVVDVLFTNFHLPRSSLILLVSAFAGRDFLLRAYREAVEKKYRFYSYGDCMLIL